MINTGAMGIEGIKPYHKRPPRREDVGLNMSMCLVRVEGSRACLFGVEGFRCS